MAKKRTIYRTQKRYTIHFINSSGFCYRTRCDCPYSYVKEQRALAKDFGVLLFSLVLYHKKFTLSIVILCIFHTKGGFFV